MSRPPCSVDGCPSGSRIDGMCATHHKRWRMHGDPNAAGPLRMRHQSVDCPVCGSTFVLTGKSRTCSRSCGQRFRRMQTDRRRVGSTGYVHVWNPQHPLAMADGYVLEHRMVAWDHGIITDLGEVVHHINHDKQDNRPENLESLSQSEHVRRHLDEAGAVMNQYGTWPVRARP